ncbi:MAG: GNAT family N-acetyltransferase [Chloroflexota bacterium]
MHVFLETERLILRRATAEDVDALVELNTDPEVTRFINGGKPIPRDVVEDEVGHWLHYYERFAGYGFWIVVEKASGDFLGWVHLRPTGDGAPDEPELGYRLTRAAWGRGYATEASRALVERAFREHGAQRVFATTMSVNLRSRRVMEKAGLRFVRTFFLDWPDPIEGDELGDVEYALTRDEWERQQADQP